MDTALGLVAVVALVAANAFFVATEFALVAVDRTRIEQQAGDGRRRAASVLSLLTRLSYHLSGAQLGITLTSVALGFIAEPTVARLVEPAVVDVAGERASGTLSVILALLIATAFQMVMGELVPKNAAIARPLGTAKALAGPFRAYGLVARPFIWISDRAAERLTRRLGVEPAHELTSTPSLDDLEYLVRSSGDEGVLDSAEVQLLTRTIRFGDKVAADVLVPRVALHTLDADASVADLVALSADTGRSRFPVIGDSIDDVVGIVHVKAALAVAPDERGDTPITSVTSHALAVPEGRELVAVMADLRRSRSHLAIVVDEHGGTAGVVSLEDLLEEIVGEIDDEHDDATELTVVEDEGVTVLDGGLHRDEVADACGFVIADGDYETLAGFILDALQRIPVEGEVLRVDGWQLEVVEMDRNRIASVRLHEPWQQLQARLGRRVRGRS